MSVGAKTSLAVFFAAFLCFFFSFASVSCGGQKVATLTGMNLAFGKTMETPGMFGNVQKQRVDAEPTATLALLSAIAGAALAFLRGRAGRIAGAIAGSLGLVFLIALAAKAQGDISSDPMARQMAGAIKTEFEFGYYASCLMFVAGGVLNGYLAREPVARQAVVAASGTAGGTTGAGSGGQVRFCAQCGARNSEANSFCSGCGARL